ncbi:hypothetical protein CDD81_3025 [Ophiocordyceps australis]|uniref:RBR-type E3 ubiquitin transferase n=1 Tax=Ophiocordyceps australis TaxID=1399860 RepID=A0A2C5YHR6_9HYPO|nr:hypothetical protein CDD81_3025 [Ophiocordyceps australis]
MAFNHVDPESLQLIIQLQLEDAEHLARGKQGPGAGPSDADAALAMYRQELESLLYDTDQDGINQTMHDFAGLYLSDELYPEAEKGESSRSMAGAHLVHCVACDEGGSPSQMARCPCSHEYCAPCLTHLFQSALRDGSLFPARCCGQPIPLQGNGRFLSPEIMSAYRAKQVEHTTPNKTYCHVARCSAFLAPTTIRGNTATCHRCGARTCVLCKNRDHQGRGRCREDEGTREVLRVAADRGWRRCQNCRTMVELQMGCFHMTCHCGFQFCYLCGVEWKNCPCVQWDEERLTRRAHDNARRDAQWQGLDHDLREAQIQRERENLERHDARNHEWARRRPRGVPRCEGCARCRPDYVFECHVCHLLVCRGCRFNRF